MVTHRQHSKKERRVQTFKLPSELIGRLGHYIVDCGQKEGHRVEKSEIAEQALDEFLKDKGD